MWTYNNNKLNKNSSWTHISSSFCTVTWGNLVWLLSTHSIWSRELQLQCINYMNTFVNEQLILHLSTQLFWFYSVVGSRQLLLTMQPAYLTCFNPRYSSGNCKYLMASCPAFTDCGTERLTISCHFLAALVPPMVTKFLSRDYTRHHALSSGLWIKPFYLFINSEAVLTAQQCEMTVLYLQATLWQTSNHRVS